MANRALVHGSSSSTTPAKAPVLLLMDSPRKQDDGSQLRAAWPTTEPSAGHSDETESKPTTVSSGVRRPSLTVEAPTGMMNMIQLGRMGTPVSSSSDSLGRLLVEMTAQVQDERSKRSDVEKKNQSLMLEIEQLQKEVLELKTNKEQQSRRRASGDWDAATRPDHHPTASPGSGAESAGAAGNAEFWWQELQEAKSAKDKAQHDAHRRAMEVMELNACISMQHDELKALRASDADVRFALARAEERCSEMLQQHTVLVQESQLLRDEVAHLNHEIGKRGSHFKALMDKWSEAQAQSEHWERENRAMLDKMKELRTKHEQLQQELQTVRDDRDLLQHQANHLKGAVAAKAAESKAFQAYGTNARDHLQAQHAMIQRHQIYRRKVNHIARDSVSLLKHIKSTLVTVRAPLVTIQNDFRQFLKNLQTPVLALVTKSRHFAQVAHVEHAPLRGALLQAELTRRHLHDQLWRQRRNALLVCQIRNVAISTTTVSAIGQSSTTADTILGMADPLSCTSSLAESGSGSGSGRGQSLAHHHQQQRTLRANYGTGELLLRETDRETLTVKCDAVFSDRARGAGCWNNHESVAPLLQSVLDGFNACVATFDGLPPLKLDDGVSATTSSSAATDASNNTMGVPELVLTQLFELLGANGVHFHRIKLTISFLGVFNEAIYDLLGLDPHGAMANSSTNPSASTSNMNKIVVLEVQNVEEALLVLRGGMENLETAHELGVMDKFATHKVITVCVTHENLLVPGNSPTKTKLQIVELATGPPESGDISTSMGDWEDRSKVKAHVAMENGIQALLTTLADVRVAADSSGGSNSSSSSSSPSSSSGFVRYHSSKLTVLLQDTVKPSAKFLGIAALPGVVSSASSSSSSSSTSSGSAAGTANQQPQLDTSSAMATRWLYELRQAVGSSAGASTSSHGVHDRSVEGFINRYTTHHADHNGGKGGAGGGGGVGGSATSSLAFSSAELAERQASADVDPRQWEKEYDRMTRRYGDLAAFTTTFYQPTLPSTELTSRNGWSSSRTESYSSRATSPRRQSACTVANADQLTDVVIRPHELVAVDSSMDVSSGSSSSSTMAAMMMTTLLPPPPAPVKTKPRAASVKSRVQGHRNGTKSRVHSTTTATMVGGSSDTVTTLAPRRGMTMAATTTANNSSHKTAPMVKLRRETASSHLKKAIATQSSSSTAGQSTSSRSSTRSGAAASAGSSSQVYKTKSVPFK